MTHVLTLIAGQTKGRLPSDLVAETSRVLLDLPGEVGTPLWLSPEKAADIPFTPASSTGEQTETDLRHAVGRLLANLDLDGIDTAVLPTVGRRKGLLIADMDSTIVTGETLDDLAGLAGIGEQVSGITRRAMNGEIDFEGALRERVAMLKGQSTELLDRILASTTLTPGAIELVATMRSHGARCVLVSGGFTVFTGEIAQRVGFDADFGNTLIMAGGVFTGSVGEPILGRDAKLATLRAECEARNLTTASALAVGDGANDLAMIKEAGMGVAFHAKPAVRAEAPVVIDHGDLTSLLYLQGYADSEFTPA